MLPSTLIHLNQLPVNPQIQKAISLLHVNVGGSCGLYAYINDVKRVDSEKTSVGILPIADGIRGGRPSIQVIQV